MYLNVVVKRKKESKVVRKKERKKENGHVCELLVNNTVQDS